LLALVLAGCSARLDAGAQHEAAPSSAAVSRARVQRLREREAVLRRELSPSEQPPWLDVSGADPYRIAALGDGFVGILRGSKALVHLDHELHELARIQLPESPTALCVAGTTAFVASRYDSHVWPTRLGNDGRLEPEPPFDVGSAGVADLACDDETVHVLPAEGTQLLTLDARGRRLSRASALAGGLRLRRAGSYLLELSLFERSLRVLELGPHGQVRRELGRIRHDGTLWGFDVLQQGAQLLVAVAGVEDQPLVRAHGEFENIDSFVWIYRLGGSGRLEPLAALDVSDSGLLVPKALALRAQREGGFSLTVLAAGSGRLLRASFADATFTQPVLEVVSAPPGASDAVFSADGRSAAYTSPLFDAFVAAGPGGVKLRRTDAERRPSPTVRLGEALFFTELMAPENFSAGTHSRFSCETCHFEGGVDGRTHYTGRGEVSVVTKPLLGLANNRPHFSRAMDPDLSSVCHNEFRVAGAGSGTDPWFSLETARFPWLADLGIERATLSPLELREALLQFLYAFSHAPNPHTRGRTRFSELELSGAAAFRDHCASCHRPRLVTDDPNSEVGFEDWQSAIFRRNAPLTWASPDYAKTGVVPYVHERGTRVTSLRRLALKPRYFTTGEAPDLPGVLERFRETPGGALHVAPPGAGSGLTAAERRALLAFLQLL
jgi:cytochrome c peroxidase